MEGLIKVNETLCFVNLTTDCRKCHQCEECGKICLTSSFLKKHKRLHSSERPHKCSICNAAFKEKSYLKKHNVTHTGVKEFKCDFCDKRFSHQREFFQYTALYTLYVVLLKLRISFKRRSNHFRQFLLMTEDPLASHIGVFRGPRLSSLRGRLRTHPHVSIFFFFFLKKIFSSVFENNTRPHEGYSYLFRQSLRKR